MRQELTKGTFRVTDRFIFAPKECYVPILLDNFIAIANGKLL